MGKSKMICPCKDLSKKDLKKEIEKGITSYKELKKTTGVGSKCGKCKKDVKKYIEKVS